MECSEKKNGTGPVSPSCRITDEITAKILDSLDAVVFVTDLESHEILFANNYFKQLFGFDPTGRVCRQFMHSQNEEFCVLCDKAGFPDSPVQTDNVICREYRNPFNKKWYAAKDQVITWSDGRRARLEIALDITEQKQLQSFLQEARQQAENAISTKNRFVALVAHDLKSPFVSILGMLKRILQKETFTYEVHRKFLESIISNGQRMLKMIDNLLDMDRLEKGKIKPEPSYFNVNQTVSEVFENFTHLAERKNIQLENMVGEDVEIYADRYLYFVVLNNLISNAVKFSYVDGKISVSFDESEEDPHLTVRDQGQGIPRDCMKNLFSADVKTTTPGTDGEPGSGLGLVFSQQIMRAHGGTIEFESEEGKGTVFFVKLGPSCRLLDSDRRRI